MKIKHLAICTVMLLICGSFTAGAQVKGSAMPEFTFYRLDDSPFTKRNITGGTQSLFLYFDPSCEHCQAEAESLGKKFAEFKNVTFYLVSSSTKAQIGKFMDTYAKLLKGKKNVTVLYDRDMIYISKFLPTQYPDLQVFSTQGRLVKHFSGTTNVSDVVKAVKGG